MKTVFLFGGQGSQLPGMALDIRKEFPQTEELFQTAFEINPGFEQILVSKSEEINQTKYTQPAIALFGAAVTQVLRENGIEADAAIGSSIGEYPALAALDVWSLADMLQIASARGKLMTERLIKRRAEGFEDGMHAVLGLDEATIAPFVEKFDQLWITNINDAKQVVISGEVGQLAEIEPELKAAGARRIVPLAVEGAFHTPIFGEEQADLLQIIEQYSINIPQKQFYFNRNGKSLLNLADSPAEHKADVQLWMSEQMISPVGFYECGEKLFADQAEPYDLAIEISAKSVMAGMLRKKIKNIETVQINNAQQLKEFLHR